MNADVIASVLVKHLRAAISQEDARKILVRNTRLLPADCLDEYHSLVYLEAGDLGGPALDADEFEAICNRVSKRIIYAAKKQSERFDRFDPLRHEPPTEDSKLKIRDILESLSVEEQSYLIMKKWKAEASERWLKN